MMKKLISWMMFMVFSVATFAQKGVNFEPLTFDEALVKAGTTDKLVFIDCYTSWCGPCKDMINTVFPREKAGEFFNPRFICVKYDMEKDGGPELAKKFDVRAYPTFIILNPDGTVRHKLFGGGEIDEFIERVKEAYDDTKATGLMEAEYEKGNRDKEFLARYARNLWDLHSPEAGKVAGELFQALSDEEKISLAYWFVFENTHFSPEGSEGEKYLLANRDRFRTVIGKEKVDARLCTRLKQKLMLIAYGRDHGTTEKDLDRMKKEMLTLKLGNEKVLLANINIARAVITKDADRLLAVCEKEVTRMPAEDYPYIPLVWTVKEKATPLQARRWIKIGEQLHAKSQSEEYKRKLERYMKDLEREE